MAENDRTDSREQDQGPGGTVAQVTKAPAPRKVARVATVAPPQDADTSDEEGGEQEAADVDDTEILEDLPDDTEEIELIHSRLGSISRLGLQRFRSHLRKLCLRQNYIAQLDPGVVKTLEELEELDMYDNKLKTIDDASFSALKKLSTLDLSFNLLRHVPEALEYLPSLKTVFFVQNKISHISGLGAVGATLRSLELGGNRIRKIENLDSLVNLEELWLGKNKIAKLEGLDALKRLRILSIQSNRITKLEGLQNLESLEEFYISHNGIIKLEGLEGNSKLRTLDIGNNFVEILENVSHLSHLEELWVNDNKIASLDALGPQLSHTATLETIYLEGNPVQKKEGAGYRRKVILALPQITQLDATYVKQI